MLFIDIYKIFMLTLCYYNYNRRTSSECKFAEWLTARSRMPITALPCRPQTCRMRLACGPSPGKMSSIDKNPNYLITLPPVIASRCLLVDIPARLWTLHVACGCAPASRSNLPHLATYTLLPGCFKCISIHMTTRGCNPLLLMLGFDPTFFKSSCRTYRSANPPNG